MSSVDISLPAVLHFSIDLVTKEVSAVTLSLTSSNTDYAAFSVQEDVQDDVPPEPHMDS